MSKSPASARSAELAIAVMIGVVFMGSTVVTPLYAVYAKTFGFGEVMLTLIYATYVVGNLCALLMFGRLSDQIGRKRAALPAMGVAALATLAFPFASSTPWLFVGRALSGFAIGIATGAGTAWLVELEGKGKTHANDAAVIATTANFLGLATGPLMAGLLAQYAPAPLRLSYATYLVFVLMAAILIARTDEPRGERTGHVSFVPRLGIAKPVRALFVTPAITAFCTFAFIGFYAGVGAQPFGRSDAVTNHAVGGAIVFELFLVAAIVDVMAHRWSSRTAMLCGLAAQLPTLALLVAADRLASMPLLLAASAFGGIAVALGYRGSLAVVNEIAPPEAKAELVSSYMVVCFVGNSIPVIGVALLSKLLGDPVAAVTIFAAVVGVLVLAAIAAGLLARPPARQASDRSSSRAGSTSAAGSSPPVVRQ